jgi:hypothetical protein
MKKQKILGLEQLERRDTPSVVGVDNALSNSGADHRSGDATAQLQANLAAQCSALQTILGGTTGVTSAFLKQAKLDAPTAPAEQPCNFLQTPDGGTSGVTPALLGKIKFDV